MNYQSGRGYEELAAFIFRTHQLVKAMLWLSASMGKTVSNLKLEFSVLYLCLQMKKHLTWNKKWGLVWQAVVYLLCYLKILCSDKFETYSILSELLFSGTLGEASVKLNGGELPKKVIITLWTFKRTLQRNLKNVRWVSHHVEVYKARIRIQLSQ